MDEVAKMNDEIIPVAQVVRRVGGKIARNLQYKNGQLNLRTTEEGSVWVTHYARCRSHRLRHIHTAELEKWNGFVCLWGDQQLTVNHHQSLHDEIRKRID